MELKWSFEIAWIWYSFMTTWKRCNSSTPHYAKDTPASWCRDNAKSFWIVLPCLMLFHFVLPSIRAFAVTNALVQHMSLFWILIKLRFVFFYMSFKINNIFVQPLHRKNVHASIQYQVFRLKQMFRRTVILSQFQWRVFQLYDLVTWQMKYQWENIASNTELICERDHLVAWIL